MFDIKESMDNWYEDQYYEIQQDLCRRICRCLKTTNETFGHRMLEACKNNDDLCFLLEEFLDLDSREKAVLWGDKKEFIKLLDDDYNDALGEYHYDQLYG